MKLSEILKNIEITKSCVPADTEITGISYDSRQTKKGDLFVAVRGFETDGHKYISSALDKGAAAILCEEAPEGEGPYLTTPDTRSALALASCELFGNPASSLKTIAVTGTNGKTTTTYLIKHLLECALSAKVGLIGTNGNMIGDRLIHSERTTPESYELQKLLAEMRDDGCTHVVMEASSHSLSLKRIAGIRFDVGVFTNLTQDHLDFHGSMEAYAEAKAGLFSMCRRACINLDDKWSDYMLENTKCPVISFSVDNVNADLTANDIRLSADGVRFLALYKSELIRTRLAIPGMFSVHNALGVIAAGLSLGLALSQCCASLEDAVGVKGRMEIVPTDGDYTVIIDYAHTPDALENAIRTLKEVTAGRVVVLFGCGGDRDRAKRPIMGAIAEKYADMVIVTSDNPRTEDPQEIINDILAGIKDRRAAVKVIPDRVEAICRAIDNHRPGDVILLAGKGHEDYQVIGHEKRRMDEREIVAEHLRTGKNK